MAFDWTSLILPAIGAFAGGGSDTQTTTSTSDPWKAAQPYMLRNLQDTEQLGNALKKTPFNPQQIESYSNLFSDNNNFRSNIAPGLMDFANKGMGSNYQRARVNRPGDVAGYGRGNSAQGQMQQPSGGSGGLLGPFSVASGGGSSGGLLDLNGAQNPFQNGGVKANPQTVNEQMISDLKAELGLTGSAGNDSGDNQYGGGGGYDGGNPGSLMNGNAPQLNPMLAMLSPSLLAAYNAMMRSGYDQSAGSKEQQAYGTPGWGKAVNDYAAARAARQAGIGMDIGGDGSAAGPGLGADGRGPGEF